MSEKIAFTYARIARKLLFLGVTYYILHWSPEGAPENIPYGKVSLFSTRFDMELKVAFFQKVRFVFLNLQISKKNIPKNYPELEI